MDTHLALARGVQRELKDRLGRAYFTDGDPIGEPDTLRKAAAEGFAPGDAALERLGEEELGLIKLAAQFPRLVEAAAVAREPHRVAFFLQDLAAAFHGYWNVGNDRPEKRFIVAQDSDLTAARLYLATQIGQLVRNGLALLGVEAVEEM